MARTIGRRECIATVATGSVLGAAGCVGESSGTELSIALTFTNDHTQAQMVERFGETISEESDGELEIDPLYGGQIGGEEEQIESTAGGSIDMHGSAIGALTQAYGTEYGFLETPFVVTDWETYQQLEEDYVFADGEFNDQMIEEGNQRILASAFRGDRHFTSNFEVTHPDDVQGVALRLAEFDNLIAVWEGVGADVQPVSFDELYSALETGVVDASEGPIQQFLDASLQEVQSHFSLTSHMTQTNQYVINENTWQNLTEDHQEILVDSLEEAIEWANQQTRDEAEELMDYAEDEYGTEIVEDVDRDAFYDAAEDTIMELFDEQWVPDFDDIESIIS